jgi:hypothetical protein
MRDQAIDALIIAHQQGVFQMKKMDRLRDYFFDLLNNFFEKFNKEASAQLKIEVHWKLCYMIFSICLDNVHLENVDSEEQERIDDSKFYYFGLIFKHFNSFEEKTKNILLKIYFYRLLDGKKFKEPSTKPYFGPLTKEEYRNGLKHPQCPERNPLTSLLKYSLGNVGKDEHDCIYEFVKILNSKAKLNLEISHMLLRI